MGGGLELVRLMLDFTILQSKIGIVIGIPCLPLWM